MQKSVAVFFPEMMMMKVLNKVDNAACFLNSNNRSSTSYSYSWWTQLLFHDMKRHHIKCLNKWRNNAIKKKIPIHVCVIHSYLLFNTLSAASESVRHNVALHVNRIVCANLIELKNDRNFTRGHVRFCNRSKWQQIDFFPFHSELDGCSERR